MLIQSFNGDKISPDALNVDVVHFAAKVSKEQILNKGSLQQSSRLVADKIIREAGRSVFVLEFLLAFPIELPFAK